MGFFLFFFLIEYLKNISTIILHLKICQLPYSKLAKIYLLRPVEEQASPMPQGPSETATGRCWPTLPRPGGALSPEGANLLSAPATRYCVWHWVEPWVSLQRGKHKTTLPSLHVLCFEIAEWYIRAITVKTTVISELPWLAHTVFITENKMANGKD